jgi:hypothetical protein
MHIDYWLKSQKERDHYEDQDIGGLIILRWDGAVSIGLPWLGIGTSRGLL